MAYIKGLKGHINGCLFCVLREQPAGPKSLILLFGEHVYLMLNAFPYNTGHLMVVPKRHVRGPGSLSAAESAEFMAMTACGEAALRTAYRPHGFNMGINIGRTSGAGVVGTAISISCPGGTATPTSCRSSAAARCCRKTWRRPMRSCRPRWAPVPAIARRREASPNRAPGPPTPRPRA